MSDSSLILAVSDAGVYAMWAVQILISTALGIVLWRLAQTTTRLDRSEDQRRADLKDLSGQLHDANTKLLDERDRRISHSIKEHIGTISGAVEIWRKRVEVTETQIQGLASSRSTAEIELNKAIANFREFVRECAPSRKEFEKVEDSLVSLNEKVEKLARENINLDDMRRLLKEVRQG